MRKLHNDGKPIRVDDRLDALRARLRETPGMVAAYLFGSYGTAAQTPLSDIDIALVFRAGAAPEPAGEIALAGMVTETLREDDVSVVVLNKAPCAFQHRVLREGRALLVLDHAGLADFTEQVLNCYCDFVVDRERFLHEYDTALRERFDAA